MLDGCVCAIDWPVSSLWRELAERRFGDRSDEPASAKAAYEAHVAAVRETIVPERLFEYVPGDGWGPLCAALGLAVPDEPFPHKNTRHEFVERMRGSG